MVLFNSILSQPLFLNSTRKRGKSPLLKEHTGNGNMHIYILILVCLLAKLLQLFVLAELQILNYVLKVFIFLVVQLYYRKDVGKNIKTSILKTFLKKHIGSIWYFLKFYQLIKFTENIKTYRRRI